MYLKDDRLRAEGIVTTFVCGAAVVIFSLFALTDILVAAYRAMSGIMAIMCLLMLIHAYNKYINGRIAATFARRSISRDRLYCQQAVLAAITELVPELPSWKRSQLFLIEGKDSQHWFIYTKQFSLPYVMLNSKEREMTYYLLYDDHVRVRHAVSGSVFDDAWLNAIDSEEAALFRELSIPDREEIGLLIKNLHSLRHRLKTRII